LAKTPIWLALDMDGDGALTVADAEAIVTRLPDWAAMAYFYPGDAFISFLLKYDATLGLARHFEIKPEWYGGLFSAFISVVVWIVAALILIRVATIVGRGLYWLRTLKKRRRMRARLP
jgi:hypothetical protein